eukprot:Rmarinus@m.24151
METIMDNHDWISGVMLVGPETPKQNPSSNPLVLLRQKVQAVTSSWFKTAAEKAREEERAKAKEAEARKRALALEIVACREEYMRQMIACLPPAFRAPCIPLPPKLPRHTPLGSDACSVEGRSVHFELCVDDEDTPFVAVARRRPAARKLDLKDGSDDAPPSLPAARSAAVAALCDMVESAAREVKQNEPPLWRSLIQRARAVPLQSIATKLKSFYKKPIVPVM